MGTRQILERHGVVVKDTVDIMPERKIEYNVNNDTITKPTLFISKGSIEAAVKAGVVPEMYKDCEFDPAKVKENITNQIKALPAGRKFKAINVTNYINVTNEIMITLTANKIPNQSYLIGAPNGFGKTSFANSCIIKLFSQGRMCTPLISLYELAALRDANMKSIAKGIVTNKYY